MLLTLFARVSALTCDWVLSPQSAMAGNDSDSDSSFEECNPKIDGSIYVKMANDAGDVVNLTFPPDSPSHAKLRSFLKGLMAADGASSIVSPRSQPSSPCSSSSSSSSSPASSSSSSSSSSTAPSPQGTSAPTYLQWLTGELNTRGRPPYEMLYVRYMYPRRQLTSLLWSSCFVFPTKSSPHKVVMKGVGTTTTVKPVFDQGLSLSSAVGVPQSLADDPRWQLVAAYLNEELAVTPGTGRLARLPRDLVGDGKRKALRSLFIGKSPYNIAAIYVYFVPDVLHPGHWLPYVGQAKTVSARLMNSYATTADCHNKAITNVLDHPDAGGSALLVDQAMACAALSAYHDAKTEKGAVFPTLVILETPDPSNLDECESYWITRLNSRWPNGLNKK